MNQITSQQIEAFNGLGKTILKIVVLIIALFALMIFKSEKKKEESVTVTLKPNDISTIIELHENYENSSIVIYDDDGDLVFAVKNR